MTIRLALRFAALICAAMLFYYLIVLPTRCNRAIRAAELSTRRALSAMLPERTANRMASDNIRMLQAAAAGCRHNFDFYLILALNKKIVGRREEAIVDLSSALRTADRPEIYFDRGLLHLESGQLDDAIRDLRTAAEFNPHLLHQFDSGLRAEIEKNMRTRVAR